jgi:hypothetical protein
MNRFLTMVLSLCLLAGCSRAYYRQQADGDALCLIEQKADDPHWSIDDYHILPDETSRMYDPFDPDHEPMPCDDPAAHRFMKCVDGKKGWKHWYKNGTTDEVENPQWLDFLPMNEEGQVVLSAEEAVRQGFINSPNYQREFEEVYLTALDVSFERFRFDTQFFAGYGAEYVADGRLRNGDNDSSSTFTLSTFPPARGVRAQRLFTTGSDLVVGFANSLVWQVSGPNDYQGTTFLDFAFTQPLLRNAGKARVMERLTRSERTLLYNVRALERYRQAYYVQILTGRDPGQGPSRSGGVFGGSGLEGFSGVGGGGFGRVTTTTATGASGSGAAGAGAQQAGGYLGLLQVQQEMRNQEDNIQRLRDNANQLETSLQELLLTRAPAESVLRQRLQVAQAKQALINAQSRLLNSRNGFESLLDNFKAVLGLPPELCVLVEDDLIDDFQLIEPITNAQQRQVARIIDSFGLINRRMLTQATSSNDAVARREIPWSETLQADLQAFGKEVSRLESLVHQLREKSVPATEANLQEIAQAIPQRSNMLQELKTKFNQEKDELCRLLPVTDLDERVFETKRLQQLPIQLNREFKRIEEQLDLYPERIASLKASLDDAITNGASLTPEARFQLLRNDLILAGQTILSDLRFDILALQLLQARSRTESVQLAKVDLKAEEALQIASKYRHDWMNAQAALVDQWRLIEFNANALKSQLDIIFSGDVTNNGDNPFNLNSNAGRLRAGVRFDSPLTRLSERNVYRQSLIEFQQARRNYYTFEDTVARGLRQQLRTISANQLNFELQRMAVMQAAEQILLNDDIRARQEATGQAAGDTAARDSVSALADLLDAQNNFLSVYVNYEVLRRQLDLDLGTLKVDCQGHWLDPGVISAERMGLDAEAPTESLMVVNKLEPETHAESSVLPDLPITDEEIDDIIEYIDQMPEELPAAKVRRE